MALIQCDFSSVVLGMAYSMNVILPQSSTIQSNTTKPEYPVLYLLHGCSDDHTTWCRRTSIERYVAGMNLAVVMPNVHRSYYTNMKSGAKYWTFVADFNLEKQPYKVKKLVKSLSVAPKGKYNCR